MDPNPAASLDSLHRKLLDRIQLSFPLTENPYAELARELNSDAEQIHRAVLDLRESRVIRRIGGSFVPVRLGYISALVASRVDPARLEEAAACASAFPEVTHNYERRGVYNLWFTVIAENRDRMDHILGSVRQQPGVTALHELPAIHTFKLRVKFQFSDDRRPRSPGAATASDASPEPIAIDDLDRLIIARCCGDIGESPQPFVDLATELGASVDDLLGRLRRYRETGALRRFGAILRHQKAGFSANGMSVWDVAPEDVARVGGIMAAFPEVSHCYERPRMPDWPYNVYGMIHGHSEDECLAVGRRIARETGLDEFRMLFSVREFKKTSMVYLAPDTPPAGPMSLT